MCRSRISSTDLGSRGRCTVHVQETMQHQSQKSVNVITIQSIAHHATRRRPSASCDCLPLANPPSCCRSALPSHEAPPTRHPKAPQHTPFTEPFPKAARFAVRACPWRTRLASFPYRPAARSTSTPTAHASVTFPSSTWSLTPEVPFPRRPHPVGPRSHTEPTILALCVVEIRLLTVVVFASGPPRHAENISACAGMFAPASLALGTDRIRIARRAMRLELKEEPVSRSRHFHRTTASERVHPGADLIARLSSDIEYAHVALVVHSPVTNWAGPPGEHIVRKPQLLAE